MRRQKFQFTNPYRFRSKFEAERYLWELAQKQTSKIDAIREFLSSGLVHPEPDPWTLHLYEERYRSFETEVSNELSNTFNYPPLPPIELERTKYSDPPRYAKEQKKVQQTEAARKLLTKLTLHIPNYGDKLVSTLTRADLDEWERQVDLQIALAEKQRGPVLPWRALFDRFPDAKTIGDIPDWQNEVGKVPALSQQVRAVA